MSKDVLDFDGACGQWYPVVGADEDLIAEMCDGDELARLRCEYEPLEAADLLARDRYRRPGMTYGRRLARDAGSRLQGPGGNVRPVREMRRRVAVGDAYIAREAARVAELAWGRMSEDIVPSGVAATEIVARAALLRAGVVEPSGEQLRRVIAGLRAVRA